MKQYISEEQLKELDLAKYKNLIIALENSGAPFEVLEIGGQYLATNITIGLMIELLQSNEDYADTCWWPSGKDFKKPELCDILWESVKEFLKEDPK